VRAATPLFSWTRFLSNRKKKTAALPDLKFDENFPVDPYFFQVKSRTFKLRQMTGRASKTCIPFIYLR